MTVRGIYSPMRIYELRPSVEIGNSDVPAQNQTAKSRGTANTWVRGFAKRHPELDWFWEMRKQAKTGRVKEPFVRGRLERKLTPGQEK